MTLVIKNSVTGQIEQFIEDHDQADDILNFLNAADVKDGGEPVSFESEEYVPPEPPPEPAMPIEPPDEG